MGPAPADARERGKRLVRAFYGELWNRFDTDAIPRLLAEDVRFRGSLGAECVGHDAFAAYVERIRAACPDFHNEVLALVGEDERAFARLRYTGTHTGELLGFPGTGARIEYSGAALFTFRDGRIASAWVLGDLFGLRALLERQAL